jgi:hypothetical protein
MNGIPPKPSLGCGSHTRMDQWCYGTVAFTLAELMISISILSCLLLLVSQLISGVSNTTAHTGKLMDSDNQARLIFAKMAEDFRAILVRPDVNYYFKSQSGNDAFYFYSQAPGHIASEDPVGTSDSTLNTTSLVGYRVSDGVGGSNRAELERLGRGLHWIDGESQNGNNGRATAVQFLPFLIKDAFSNAIADAYNNSSNPNTNLSATDVPQWDVVGDQVFRMEFCFLLKDGTFSSSPVVKSSTAQCNLTASTAPGSGDDLSAGYTIGSRWYDTASQVAYVCDQATTGAAVWTPQGLRDVKAVVVTMALMDTKSRNTTNFTTITKAIAALGDFTNTSFAAKTWMASTNDVKSFARSTGLTLTAASSIRVYERFFYLN